MKCIRGGHLVADDRYWWRICSGGGQAVAEDTQWRKTEIYNGGHSYLRLEWICVTVFHHANVSRGFTLLLHLGFAQTDSHGVLIHGVLICSVARGDCSG